MSVRESTEVTMERQADGCEGNLEWAHGRELQERMQVRFLPLKGGTLYSPKINKSVMEHYQVTPCVRWKQSGIIRIET